MDCKFCSFDWGRPEASITKIYSNVYKMVYEVLPPENKGDSYCYIVKIFDLHNNDVLGKTHVDIKYCPFCGRHLVQTLS